LATRVFDSRPIICFRALVAVAPKSAARGNLVGAEEWEKLRNRIKVEEFLKRNFPAFWEMIETMQNDKSLLQRRGAQVFFPAYERALKTGKSSQRTGAEAFTGSFGRGMRFSSHAHEGKVPGVTSASSKLTE
jgi:hypothetical protein